MTSSYFRFLKDLVRLEEKEESEELKNELLELTPAERELRGLALLNLTLKEKHYSLAEHALATFVRYSYGGARHAVPLPLFTLEVGDLVTLVPQKRGIASDYPSGTVFDKNLSELTVAFNHELPEWAEEGASFELHESTNRATYKRMLEALDAVYETQNTRLAFFRDVSLELKKPELEKKQSNEIRWFDESLNASQKEAVKKVLQTKDISLVHGPPGTGKTTVLIEIIRQSLLKKESIYVTAPSNTACDNILERLVEKGIPCLRIGHPARISNELRGHTLDFKLALHPTAELISRAQTSLERLFNRGDRYRDRRPPAGRAGSPGRDGRLSAGRQEKEVKHEISLLKQEIRNLKKEVFERVMKENDVFIGTPAGIQDKALRDKGFDLVLIDEATQATEPISWIPIAKAKKVVMAGDHFQLPPTVRSKKAEEQGLGISLFERLYEVLDQRFKTLLDRQYRMNEKIMGFSSKIFYKNLLVADESVRTHTLADLRGVQKCAETTEPVVFLDTAGKGFEEKLEIGSESRYNTEEAAIVLSELKKVLALGVPPAQIAVISPYSAQVRYLAAQSPDASIEIDSVDGFQGREKELVIVSLVRSNMAGEMGFLADTRRMNVAMTRARRKLLVIGDSATLSTIPFYKQFIEYAESINGYKTVWEQDY